MILSYVPRQRDQCGSSLNIKEEEVKSVAASDADNKDKRKKPSLGGKRKRKGEGLYFSSMGKNDNEDDRERDTEKILNFINCVFTDRKSIDFEEFSRFNTENSSEMLFAVMSVLHERIPCSEFYYREKREFKNQAVRSALTTSKD